MVEKILSLMETEGINAKELTVRTGLGHSAITDWKKGKAKPSTDAVVKIADYFGVTTDYLLGRADERGPMDIPGKNNESVMQLIKSEKGNIIMDIDDFKKLAAKSELNEAKKNNDIKKAIDTFIKESLNEFTQYFESAKFKILIEDDAHFIRRIAQWNGYENSSISFVCDRNGQIDAFNSAKFKDSIAGLNIYFKIPEEKIINVYVKWSKDNSSQLEFYYRKDRSDEEGVGNFNSLTEILEILLPSKKEGAG